MDLLTNFSKTLKSLLEEKDLTIVEFSKEVGLTDTTVYDYLNKIYLPSVPTLIAIADYFNCTTDFLFGLDDENLSEVFYSYKPFTEQLEEIKKRYGKSEYYITKNTGIAEGTFYSWKRGAHMPSVENLIKIAKLFGCSLDYVLGRAKH